MTTVKPKIKCYPDVVCQSDTSVEETLTCSLCHETVIFLEKYYLVFAPLLTYSL